jgi:regulatory protein YycH of two-component signal transduction system YycFG
MVLLFGLIILALVLDWIIRWVVADFREMRAEEAAEAAKKQA